MNNVPYWQKVTQNFSAMNCVKNILGSITLDINHHYVPLRNKVDLGMQNKHDKDWTGNVRLGALYYFGEKVSRYKFEVI